VVGTVYSGYARKRALPVPEEGIPVSEEDTRVVGDPNEALKMRLRADAMMLRYAIAEIMADQSKPAEERTKPTIITVEVGGWDSDILNYIGDLAADIAKHCRCKIRVYSKYDYDAKAWQAKVYGFESDVRYFEFLYTTLRLHMLGVLIPKMDPALSFQENCYRLHNAGYNWLEIAAMEGWRKYPGQNGVPGHLVRFYNPSLGEELPAGKIGGLYKRAYYAACKEKGESPLKLAAGGTDTYRKSAAYGYTSRLDQRLRAVRDAREAASTGAEIVLLSRLDDLDKMYREDNPELFPTEEQIKAAKTAGKKIRVRASAYKAPKFSEAGYQNGVKHANTADLGHGVSNTRRGEIS
jgi:hypothetical protein